MTDSIIAKLISKPNAPHPVQQLRLQILDLILYGTFAVTTVIMLYTVSRTLQNNQWWLLAIYTGCYGAIGFVTFVHQLGFVSRATTLLLLVYTVGVIDLVQAGILGNGTLFFLAFISLTATLFSLRYGIAAIICSVVTIIFLAWLSITQILTFPLQSIYLPFSAVAWVRVVMVLLLLSAMIIIPIRYLLKRLEYQLQETQAHFHFTDTILDMVNAMVLVLDQQGRIIRANQTNQQITGYSAAELEGKLFWDVLLPPDKKESGKQVFYNFLFTPTPMHQETELLTKNNHYRIISWSGTIIPNDLENSNFIVAVGIDITDNKQTALERERLLAQEREQRQFSEALRGASLALGSTLKLETLYDRLLDHVRNIVPYDAANLMLITDNRIKVTHTRGYEQFGPEVINSVTGLEFEVNQVFNLRQMAETGQPMILSDVRQVPEWINTRASSVLQSWAGSPIVIHGKLIAFFSLDKKEPGFYQQTHADRLAVFSAQAALSIENARLFAAEAQGRQEAETLHQATSVLTAALELPDVLEAILVQLKQVIPYDGACIFLQSTGILTAVAGKDLPAPEKIIGKNFPVDDLLFHHLKKTQQPLSIPNIDHDPRILPWGDITQVKSWLGIPLITRNEVIGYMILTSSREHAYDRVNLSLAKAFANQSAIAIENANLYKAIQRHAAELETNIQKRTFQLHTLYDLAQSLGQANQVSEIPELILRHLYQAAAYDIGATLLVTETNTELLIQSQHPLTVDLETEIQQILTDTFTTLRGAPPATINYTTSHILSNPSSTNQLLTHKPQVILKAPIVVGRYTVGVVLIGNYAPYEFAQEQIRLVYTVADQAAETIGRLRLILAAEHQRLESLVAYLPNGIILLDAEYRVILLNQMARKLITTISPAIVGDNLTHMGEYPISAILATANSGNPFTLKINESIPQIFEIDVNSITAGPETGGWTLVIRDVTQEYLVQQRIQQQERMAAVGQLAAGIAHDFNNILTSIIGFSELLLFEQNLPPQAEEDINRIAKQGHRAAHLVRQILDFSRQTIASKQSLELVPFLKETVKLLERTLPESINIQLTIDPGEYLITADITQMQQVLTNLAVNARDAMSDGGTLTFHLSAICNTPENGTNLINLPTGDWAKLQISDTGVGIASEVQAQIFEPFFTTKEVGKGTGLGLAQVYGIIKQHDGNIDVTSELNTGTTFTIYLPCQKKVPTPITARHLSEATIPQGNQELILMVEDDPTVLDIGTTMLKHLGYRVLTSTNGQEALQKYHQHQQEIALVLTDMTMPLMGGAALTEALQRENPSVNVIALTGYPLNNESKELLAQGLIGWLQKPLSLQTLAQTIYYTLNEE